jgi:hypothetical protein
MFAAMYLVAGPFAENRDAEHLENSGFRRVTLPMADRTPSHTFFGFGLLTPFPPRM